MSHPPRSIIDIKIEFGDKTAIVTGSTEGIGFAIAQGRAKAGALVIVKPTETITLIYEKL